MAGQPEDPLVVLREQATSEDPLLVPREQATSWLDGHSTLIKKGKSTQWTSRSVKESGMEFQHLEMMLFPMGMREASAKKRGSIPSAVADQRK